jgi:hypothetical protein
MVGTSRFLVDHQRLLIERFGIRVATLVVVERSQAANRRRDVGVVRTERLFSDRQRALVKRLGVSVATLAAIELSKVV